MPARRTRRSLPVRLTAGVAAVTFLAAAICAVLVYHVERHAPHGNIRTPFDALWWTVSTMTTVGYGDHYPTTIPGRGAAAVLMICALVLLECVTAALASVFVTAGRRDVERENSGLEDSGREDTAERLAAVEARLAVIEGDLAVIRAAVSAPAPVWRSGASAVRVTPHP